MAQEIKSEVVGIYYCRGSIRGIAAGDVLKIVSEPNNLHDRNAVRVELWNGELLGRLPRDDAQIVGPLVAKREAAFAIVTGTTAARNRQPARCEIIVHIVSDPTELPDFSSKPPRRSPADPVRYPPPPPALPNPPFEFRTRLESVGDLSRVGVGSILKIQRRSATDSVWAAEMPKGNFVGRIPVSDSHAIDRTISLAVGLYGVVFYRSLGGPGIGPSVCEVKVRLVTNSAELPDFSAEPVMLRGLLGVIPTSDAQPAPVLAASPIKEPQPLRPDPARASNPACFVATAVLGDSDHPSVMQLRSWRDRVLSQRMAGRMLITVYYHIGPYFAKIVSAAPCIKPMLKALLQRVATYLAGRS